ncbi:MAG: DNA repair protein RecN [Lentihominibacter sp.]
MIRHLRISNFAIIENVDIDLFDGLNIITGETGAGKSIVIEAVSLALGSRADTAFVRSGKEKAIIQMIADFNGEEYIITREISAGGRSTCRINDEIVTLGTLSSFCAGLADIHGQYDHQSLLNPENHLTLVDLYRKDVISPAVEEVSRLFDEYSDLKSRLSALKADMAEGRRRLDFMSYELKELEEADLRPGEDIELEEEISLLQNSEKIFESLAGAYQVSSDSEFSLLSAMKQVADMVGETSGFTEELDNLSKRLSELYYEYEDACSQIRECRDRIVFDPAALDAAISRAEQLKRLKSKHGKDIQGLIEYRDELRSRIDSIDNADLNLEALEADIQKASAALEAASVRLSEARKVSAASLEELISLQLEQLGFENSRFEISFNRLDAFTGNGFDTVEFLISTNRGEPLKPLSKIASGGEMSRIMLAFKKIIGDYDEIPTMIFDEIDSGISGIAASVVGRKLREISRNHQIICITHLPQIAACGTSNFRIAKHSDREMTYTTVEPLSEAEKVQEIARLLGGNNITDTTLASARELIEASE